MEKFEDIVSGVEVEGASAPSAEPLYNFDVYLYGEDDPVSVPYASLAYDEDELVLTANTGTFTSFRWEVVRYYTGKAVL